MHPSRRAVLLGGAALPLLRIPAFAASPPGTLTFGLSTFPPALQPWAQTGTAAVTVKALIYRGLLSFAADGKIRGELAQSWERDGTAWVFKLREAVFHNGAPVTADDVKWTLEQVAAEKSTAYFKAEFQAAQAIETPDPRTIRIVMKQPTATLPLLLANPHMPILARGSTDGQALGIGAGPYVLKAQERGVSLDFTASDKYYKPGLPKTKAIRMVVYADENLRVTALQAGDVDMIEYVPWQHMQAIEADPRLKLDAANGPFMALSFNGTTGPFKDARLRRAVAYAIRREEIVQAAFFGRGAPLLGLPIEPGNPFYEDRFAKVWSYQPEKAKALMAEAGVAKGFSCTLLSTAQYGMHKSTAEIVQQHLAEIGIQANLNLPDWATRVNMGNKGQYEFCVQGTTADNNDPDGLASLIDGELPASVARSFGLSTPRIHELFIAGRAEFDPAKRKVLYNELFERALDEAPMVGLAWRSQGYGMAKNVMGFKSYSGALNFFSGLGLEETFLA
ncbi:MAG: peptide ABC transporter substrate-binding protein [Proteobacteria bacterium]|nr:peptide ABC transporter substrate-binding protein [Pseudomonadota bacterium]